MRLKKMIVWNNPKAKYERYAIHVNPDNSCIAIRDIDEKEYEKTRIVTAYMPLAWDHCEPISEKNTRTMTWYEALKKKHTR